MQTVALEYTGLSLDEVQADDFRDLVFRHEDVQRLRKVGSRVLQAQLHSKTSNEYLAKKEDIGGS